MCRFDAYRSATFAGCLLFFAFAGCQSQAPTKPVVNDASDDFFAGPIVVLELKVKPKDAEKINRDDRPYVPCTLIERDAAGNKLAEYSKVAIKLKGAAGSFQHFDGKPGLTLRPDKFVPGQKFHDLARFHLNNAVQDETYLNEQLSSELFLSAKVPASRVTHARVKINDRDVGLYVLKEGFDERFLARHFSRGDGNLYDGGFCTDIDADLEKDCGSGPEDRSDLAALRAACHTDDVARRAELLEQAVDIDPFLSFVALELMTCHWDGYACSANNYRLYFDPATNKAHFFPHGMDQMFGDPNFSIVNMPTAMVARTVLEHPRWREQFQQRVKELLPLFSPPDKLTSRIDALASKLQSVLREYGPEAVERHATVVRELKERIVARAQSLEEQKSFPAPQPVEFDENGVLHLTDWHPASQVEDAALEFIELTPEKHVLKIASGSLPCIASWRTGLLLPRGRYVFTARASVHDVVALEDEKGAAAGLRISGVNRDNRLEGTQENQELRFEFSIEEEARQVEFVAELRAERGSVLFELESLQLQRTE